MAVYTITLGELIERGYQLKLNDYPIFNEKYRAKLNEKIINHYWDYEIGLETPDSFNRHLRMRMCEIMDYYNVLYQTNFIKYDPLITEYREMELGIKTTKAAEEGRQSVRNDYDVSNQAETLNRDTKGTNDFTETFDENRLSGYGKSGDHKIHTDITKTEDLDSQRDYSSTKTTDMTDDTQGTHTLHQTDEKDYTEDTTYHSTTVLDSDTTGEKTDTLSKTETFSDVPQAGYETITTIAPDGTTTITGKGYITTQTNTNQTETQKTKGTQDDTTTVDSTNNRVGHETDNRDLTENSTSVLHTIGTIKDEGEEHIAQDNTIITGEDETKDWKEGGSDEYVLKNGTHNFTGTTANQQDNKQSQTRRDTSSLLTSSQAQKELRDTKTTQIESGRKGISPANLILEFRKTIINIDMMIINDLRSLFMLIY